MEFEPQCCDFIQNLLFSILRNQINVKFNGNVFWKIRKQNLKWIIIYLSITINENFFRIDYRALDDTLTDSQASNASMLHDIEIDVQAVVHTEYE